MFVDRVQQLVVSNVWLESYADAIHTRVVFMQKICETFFHCTAKREVLLQSPENVYRGIDRLRFRISQYVRFFHEGTAQSSTTLMHIPYSSSQWPTIWICQVNCIPFASFSVQVVFEFFPLSPLLTVRAPKSWLQIGKMLCMNFEYGKHDTSEFGMIVLKNLASIVAFIANMCWSL